MSLGARPPGRVVVRTLASPSLLVAVLAIAWAVVMVMPGPVWAAGPAGSASGAPSSTSGPHVPTPATNNSTPVWQNVSGTVGTPPGDRSMSSAVYDPVLGATVLFGGYNGAGGNIAFGDTWEYRGGAWTEIASGGGPSPRWGVSMVYDPALQSIVLFGGRDSGQILNDTWTYNASGWHKLATPVAPSIRYDAGITYDAADGYVVLFGGVIGNVPAGSFTNFVFFNDTWTFQYGAWTNITATAGAAPAPRRAFEQMAYDPADGYVLLTGGYAWQMYCGSNWSSAAYAQTWSFAHEHWSQLTPSGTSPPSGLGAVVWDSGAGEILYYEGMANLSADGCPVMLGEVWGYLGGSWSLVAPSTLDPKPQARILPTLVDDAGDAQEILFGGQTVVSEGFGVYTSDTWILTPNGSTTPPPPPPPSNSSWENITGYVGSPPSDRSISEAAYSPALNATILFGGYNGAGGNFALGDTWQYKDYQWTQLYPSVSPSARWGASMVYDAADQAIVMFGGRNANAFLNDTWIYNATGWHNVTATVAPAPRIDAGIAYDAADGYVVLFGGGIGNIPAGSFTPFSYYNDTWTYHAGVWTNITATAGTPPTPRRVRDQMVYDPTDGYVVLTGGFGNQPDCGAAWINASYAETWTFVGGRWSEQNPAGSAPPPGFGAIVYNSQAGEVLYYEGMVNGTIDSCPSMLGYVWAYSSDAWTLVAGNDTGMPAPRILPVFVDDPGDQEELLFGGQTVVSDTYGVYANDTWSFDASGSAPPPPPPPPANGTWVNLTASAGTPPFARSIAQAAYSPALNATVLFGGYNGAGGNYAFGDTWEYAGGRWTQLPSSGGPSPRWGGSMVYDAADGTLVMFGGRDDNGFFNDTWVFNATGWHEVATARAPSPRFDFGLAYDAKDGYVVLFGGAVGNVPAGTFSPFTYYNDTWTYRAGVWTNITATAGTPPAGRRIHQQMAYDAGDGYVLLTGGYGVQPACGTPWSVPAYAATWTFAAGRWSELAATGTTPAPGIGAVWFDSAANETMYYEGMENDSSGGCPVYDGQVWGYSDGNWTLVTGVNLTMPAARIQPVVVDDLADHTELLYGGQSVVEADFGVYDNDTWSYHPSWVTFEERGLPLGTVWEVSLNGTVESTTGATLVFVEPAGSYEYQFVARGNDPLFGNLTAGSGRVTLGPGAVLIELAYRASPFGPFYPVANPVLWGIVGAVIGAAAMVVFALGESARQRARLRQEGEELVRAIEDAAAGPPNGRHR